MLSDLNASFGKQPDVVLEFLTFVVFQVQLLQQSLFYFVNVIVVCIGMDFTGQLGGSIIVELYCDLPGTVILRIAEHFI